MSQRQLLLGTSHYNEAPHSTLKRYATGGASFMATIKQSWEEWWSPSDLFFLKDVLRRGMTLAEAAGFLCRDEEEVRKKAKQMKIPYGQARSYCHYRLRRGR
jgi:NAD dependent epimerase/dehydratase family enzyme